MYCNYSRKCGPGWIMLLLPWLFVLPGCIVDSTTGLKKNESVEAFVPVYGDVSHSEIKLMLPKTVHNPGKIYVYGKYLLINEIKKGIHIYDNLEPSSPKAIGFIQLLGNTDMAMKDNILYADHMGNLIAITTDDFASLEKRGSLPINNWEMGLPPPSGSYFECIDTNKGFVIGWKKVQMNKPDCYAY